MRRSRKSPYNAGVIKVYGIEEYGNTPVLVLKDIGSESLKQYIEFQSLSLGQILRVCQIINLAR